MTNKINFGTVTVDGNTAAQIYNFRSGKAQLTATGNFDGATIQLQGSIDGTNFYNVTNGSLTAAGAFPFEASYGEQLRIAVSNDGASTSVKVTVSEIVISR